MLHLLPSSPTSHAAERPPPDALLAHFTRLAAHALRARSSFLALAGEDGAPTVQQAYAPGAADPQAEAEAAAVYERVLREGGVVASRGRRGRKGAPETEVPAYAAAPVGSGRGVVAVFDTRPRRWTRREIGVLREIAGAVDELCRSGAVGEAAPRAEPPRPAEGERGLVLRVAAAGAPRESEARYRTLFEKTPVGVLHFGPDLRVTDCNEKLVEMSGLPRERLVGLDISRLPDERILPAFRRALEGEAGSYHGPYRRRSGGEWHVAVRVSPLLDSAGRSLGGVAVVQNVTERHGAEVKLRRKEALYRLLVENASDIIYRTDVQGHFTYVNSVAARVTGYTEEELRGMHYLELLRPDFREAAGRFYRRQFEERVPSTYFEFVITGKDGGDLWIGQNVELMTKGDRVEGMQAVARNVSDQKWAEAALDETLAREREARRLAETTQKRATLLAYASEFLDGSFEVLGSDREGRLGELAYLVADTVAHSCSVHELRDDEAPTLLAHARVDPWTGRVSTEEAAPGHFAAEARLARGVMETARPLLIHELGEAGGTSPDALPAGELREVGFSSLIVVPMMARGRVLGAIVLAGATPELRYDHEALLFAQDLGRRVGLALDNARLYVEAERAARVRDELLAIVSHDLRNPLNVLSIGVNDLRRGGAVPLPPAAEKRQLDILAHSVERMNRLVRDLLDVARVESGSLAVDCTEYVAAALAHEAVEAHLPLAREKGVLLRLRLPEALPTVLADGDRILQVFSNLLGNAVRFTPESGTVTVEAEAGEGEVVFRVADDGPGIPAEEISRVFDRFWQARRARRAGAGLGLAISRGIVEAHGGRIWVESRQGEGSTFSFSLPRAAPGFGG